jgi:hypothetical protein
LCPIQGQYGALRFDYSVHTRLDYPIGSWLIAVGWSVALVFSSDALRHMTREPFLLYMLYTDRYGRDQTKPCWGYTTVTRIASEDDQVCADNH